MPLSAIKGQIAAGIDIIVHLGRMRDKTRKVLEIVEVMDYRNGEIGINTLYKFEEDSISEKNNDGNLKVQGCLKWQNNGLRNIFKLLNSGFYKEAEIYGRTD